MWRTSVSAMLLVLGALVLHRSFCEWRRFEYLETDAENIGMRLMLAIDEEVVAGGNAVFWDGEYTRFTRYDELWFECFAATNSDWAGDAKTLECLGRQNFPTESPALKAIALVRCEQERFGHVRGRAEIERCTSARGGAFTHLPQFASEIVGPRFDATYVRTWGLWAEEHSASLIVAWIAGIALPALLSLLALSAVVRGFARRNPPLAASNP